MANHENANVEKNEDYSLIFKKIDELSNSEDILQIIEDIQELEEIRELREIVLQTTSQEKSYFTST